MAESALTPDPLERYGAIERAYCEERWMAVIQDGQTLLVDLAHAVEVPPEGLRERLQLLIGHAFLYGLGDRDNAEDLYQAVLRSGAESDLRQIAAQGLEQCALPTSPAQSSLLDDEEPLEPQDGSTGSPSGGRATGWPETTDWDTPAVAELGSEADSASRPEPDGQPQDGWAGAALQTGAEPMPSGSSAALSWLTPESPEASAVAQGGGATPVMPWLEGSVASVPASEPSSQLWSTPAEAPAEAAPVPQPEAAADPSMVEGSPAWPGDQGLSPETVASLQATAAAVAAAFGQQLGGPPPTVVFMAQTPVGSDVAAPPANPGGERLVADVVEEPEQLELHQAADLGQEELLRPVETRTPPSSSVVDVTATVMSAVEMPGSGAPLSQAPAEMPLSPVAEPVPPLMLERRAADPMAAAPEEDLQERLHPLDQPPLGEPIMARIDEQTEEQRQEQTDALTDLQTDSPQDDSLQDESAAGEAADRLGERDGSGLHTRAGVGPFSAPPQPVAEEDPELLMGLLRVEMG
jgi:hypothetical protein